MPNLPNPQFKVGVSTGIYSVARTPDLGSVIRKLGYALTRGTNTIEVAADVPHEVDYTQGKELRYIAEKQDLTLLLHGSLTVPMAMPERGEWRDAQDHIHKSIRSAVMAGCKYVNFHACLHYWLEMMTYAGRKLTMSFCDQNGKFISKILAENEKLREWFITQKFDVYGGDVLTDEERREAVTPIEIKWESEREERLWEIRQRRSAGEITDEEARALREEVNETISKERTKNVIDAYKGAIRKKLEEEGKWDSEELRAVVGVIDGYHIMAHHLFYKKDPIWVEMAKVYKDVIEKYKTVSFKPKGGVEKEYAYPDGDFWLDGAWEKAERENDRRFKEFFYAVCAAKYLEGHIAGALDYLSEEKKEGVEETVLESIEKDVADKKELEEFRKYAKELKIAIEIPDARSPEYAGLYLICRVKQIYATVKTIREQLGTDKLFMLIDFEHITTQGFDAFTELKEFVREDVAPDAGKYILSVHVTKPTPLHHHVQVEIGDIDVYKLLYELRKAGLGKHHTTYLIFERGGERDPFKQSVTAIRLMVDQLVEDRKPADLLTRLEFFGVKGPNIASFERQKTVIQEHARDPIEGLLVVPEEKYTFLGKSATEKPGGAEKWKKEELT